VPQPHVGAGESFTHRRRELHVDAKGIAGDLGRGRPDLHDVRGGFASVGRPANRVGLEIVEVEAAGVAADSWRRGPGGLVGATCRLALESTPNNLPAVNRAVSLLEETGERGGNENR